MIAAVLLAAPVASHARHTQPSVTSIHLVNNAYFPRWYIRALKQRVESVYTGPSQIRFSTRGHVVYADSFAERYTAHMPFMPSVLCFTSSAGHTPDAVVTVSGYLRHDSAAIALAAREIVIGKRYCGRV